MKTVSTITAWLLLGAFCVAAQPKSVISGQNSTTAPGGLLLSSTGSVYDMGEPVWITTDNVMSMEDSKNGRVGLFYFGTTPLTTKVVLVTFGANPDGGAPLMALTSQAVSFGGSPVPPGPIPPTPIPPTPIPPAPVGPILPDGKYKLAALAYSAAMQIAQPARGDAPKVSAAITSVAASNASNTATGYDAISAVGGQLNTALAGSFGSDSAAWQPWYTAIATRVRSLYGQNNGINSVPDFCIAMNEISNGVGQVSQ